MFLRRGIAFALKVKPKFMSSAWSSFSKASSSLVLDEKSELAHTNRSSNLHLSPLFPDSKPHIGGYDIELVDDSSWQLSSGLAQAWRTREEPATIRVGDFGVSNSPLDEADPDLDDIDNLRIRGGLFYKIDRDSKEFEEYSFDFHRRKKSSKRKDDPKESKRKQNDSKGLRDNLSPSKKKCDLEENKRKQNGSEEALRNTQSRNLASKSEDFPKVMKNRSGVTALDQTDTTYIEKKKLRNPTYNQLTGPYHEPFCLDIFISNASVRACIVHRATSKVVVVAHSISKDMKFDLASTRNSTACSAVGSVLAQRALADDIHDVVYTPRKGDKLEGKLGLVLQSIIDNGINVKVKIKQRNPKKSGPPICRFRP
ncbi:uncharacterized protein LOC133819175 [Humulus lupulus]|uniref:uncharacterized protein LOC133819175 n=1 Tax=Humulus lupulus TaxID=3486 RepID=UPI002B416626|nr:uncharacterized protein LOC133819175 [Humulus lupulus]